MVNLSIVRNTDTMNSFEIAIDTTRDSLFDLHGLKRLKESYMLDSEVSPDRKSVV